MSDSTLVVADIVYYAIFGCYYWVFPVVSNYSSKVDNDDWQVLHLRSVVAIFSKPSLIISVFGPVKLGVLI